MKVKILEIRIEGTDRKRHDFERAIRLIIKGFSPKKGVYKLTVSEENVKKLK